MRVANVEDVGLLSVGRVRWTFVWRDLRKPVGL